MPVPLCCLSATEDIVEPEVELGDEPVSENGEKNEEILGDDPMEKENDKEESEVTEESIEIGSDAKDTSEPEIIEEPQVSETIEESNEKDDPAPEIIEEVEEKISAPEEPKYDVDAFIKQLSSGINVTKYDFNGKKSKKQILFTTNEGAGFTWEKKIKRTNKNYTIDKELLEVRLGTDPDPENPNLKGTDILRKNFGGNSSEMEKSLSLIYSARSVDLTFENKDMALSVAEGFRQLKKRNEG